MYHLSATQLRRVAEILMGIGHIAFASVVIPQLVDKFNPFALLLGVITALGFWIVSVIFESKT